MKYACPNASTWKLAIDCLFKILKRGLPIAFKSKKVFFFNLRKILNSHIDF